MIFYLGTCQTNWLGSINVPLFVSRRRLTIRKKLPRAKSRWALDSGGFTELSMFGEWRTSAVKYVEDVRRFISEIGNLDWAAIQDWMCEPFIIQKTGLSVKTHQEKTVESYKTLKNLAPEIPWTPVVQGFRIDDYLRCVDMYDRAGIDLLSIQPVGIGSICRRQHTREAEIIINRLASEGLNLHGLGFKIKGLDRVSNVLYSADSMAWSFAARKNPPLPGHPHKSCSNCDEYALQWRNKVIHRIIASEEKQNQLYLPL